MQSLVMCSKSPWVPSIRREHAMSLEARRNGVGVTFLERPDDVRSALRQPVRWASGFVSSPVERNTDGVDVAQWSTLIPGHRGSAPIRVENAVLARSLRATVADAAVVAYLPWHWPAVAALKGRRRVFDCTDDWSRLYPASAGRIEELMKRIGDEADAVITVSDAVAPRFGGRSLIEIPNGVDESMFLAPRCAPPGINRMVYVGTLSERFDAELVEYVLGRLPDWSLELYGECRYATSGDQPAAELMRLLEMFPDRLRWNGVVARSQLPSVLDSADVLIIPNRVDLAVGQSPMKLYDYAARGRPIVSTAISAGDVPTLVTQFASSRDDFVARIIDAGKDESANQRVEWARANTWGQRWHHWSRAVFG